jgi:hypothetical protein
MRGRQSGCVATIGLRPHRVYSAPSPNRLRSVRDGVLDLANGRIRTAGAMSPTRHQAIASSSVLPQKVCSSGEWRVTTHPAWSMSQEQEPRRAATARRSASCLQGAALQREIDAGLRKKSLAFMMEHAD